MRTTLSKMLYTILPGFGLGLCNVAGCTKEHKAKSATSGSIPSVTDSVSQSSSLRLPCGIMGLELGMTLEQVEQLFTVKEDEHPLTDFIAKCLKLGMLRRDNAIQIRYFLVSSGRAKLPEGVMWADIKTAHNKVYRIGLHYSEQGVEMI
jgi:hypothetical protein